MPLEPLHAVIVSLAAGLPEARTIALAGGGAMLAHDIVERVTRDVDLFTDRDAQEAVDVAAALRVALRDAGFRIEPASRPPHENRFVAVEESSGVGVQVEVFPDGGRLHPPVLLGVGPVLHRDDLAADKLLAMWGRGEPRDFVDVVALLDLAASKDQGFEVATFVPALTAIERLTEARWTAAGIDSVRAGAVRTTILGWRDRLTG